MDLKDARLQIDAIDDQMTKLFIERMNLSKSIAEIKDREGLNILNTERERAIVLEETAKMPEEIRVFGKQYYENLFSVSRAYQARTVQGESTTLNVIREALKNGYSTFSDSAIVACQGVLGAYSQIAADKMVKLANVVYFKDFNGVFSAVEKGMCRYGVLPIENSSVGSVNDVYDLMLKHKFYIVKAVKLRINHCLLAKKGVSIKDIKEVYSHEKAIEQCADYLKALNIKVTVCENTAVASRMVATSDRKDIACISSKECAAIYGLSILDSNINDNGNNFTRFILISKDLEVLEGANKISIMANLKHEAGSLNNILNRFSAEGLNLTKLESRPIPTSVFEFSFYFDFEGNTAHPEIQGLISELENACEKFVFLGNYSESA